MLEQWLLAPTADSPSTKSIPRSAQLPTDPPIPLLLRSLWQLRRVTTQGNEMRFASAQICYQRPSRRLTIICDAYSGHGQGNRNGYSISMAEFEIWASPSTCGWLFSWQIPDFIYNIQKSAININYIVMIHSYKLHDHVMTWWRNRLAPPFGAFPRWILSQHLIITTCRSLALFIGLKGILQQRCSC